MRRVAILVTGSREWADWLAVQDALDAAARGADHVVLIHGSAPGADTLADRHARIRRWSAIAMPAQWATDGNAAGPMRNGWMVEVLKQLGFAGYECHVLALPLPSSVGTHDCIRRARAAGFEVRVVEPREAP